MIPAKTPAILTSPSQNQVVRPAISAFSTSVSADKSNAPIACSTPHQNVRIADPSVIGSHAFGDQDLKDRAGIPPVLRAEIPDPAHLRPLPATGPDLD